MNKAQRIQAIAQQVLAIGKFSGKFEEVEDWNKGFRLTMETCDALNPIANLNPVGDAALLEHQKDLKINVLSEEMFKNTIVVNLRTLMSIDVKPWFERWIETKTANDGTLGDISTLPQDIRSKFITEEMINVRKKWYS
jgi:hypothetical protein